MKDTKIEWCDHTWSPWRGCTKVSPGCAHCYAETLSKRNPAVLGEWGKGRPRVLAKNWQDPLKWNKEADLGARCVAMGCEGPLALRPKVFPSLCDWLDDEVPVEWLARFLKLIHDTPHLDWLLLTKRPELWRECIEAVKTFALRKHYPPRSHADASAAATAVHWLAGNPPTNVWLGVSVEDQQRADERIQNLLKIPAKVRFLSVEPMLGPLDLTEVDSGRTESMRGHERRVKDNALRDRTAWGEPHRGLNWVIVGGESGPKARPCNFDWIRSVVRQCADTDVPCFVKQAGSKPYEEDIVHSEECWNEHCALSGGPEDCGGSIERRYFKFTHPKGGDPSEWPEDCRVRQIPEVQP